MTEFLHEKYKEFIRYNYGIQSGGFMCSNIEELMCDFATEIAKEYIEMASKLENENKELKNHTNRIWYNVEEKLPPCGELVLLDFGINYLHQSIIETGIIDSHGDWYSRGLKENERPIRWCEIPKLGE